MEEETWKDINEYEGIYQISNFGRVKSVERFIYKHGSSILHYIQKERILKPYLSVGYWKVDLYKNHIRTKRFVHILLAFAFIPNPLEKSQINHKDGNRKNILLSNLEWSTQSENIKHAYRQLGAAPSNKGNFGDKSHSHKHFNAKK